MSKIRLPDGVPADNETRSFSGGAREADFAAPDMATPRFSQCASDYSRVVVVVDEDEDADEEDGVVVRKTEEDDDDEIVFPKPPMPWMVVGGVAVALVALAYIVSNKNVEPQPYCSQQPEWNQYNCIPG